VHFRIRGRTLGCGGYARQVIGLVLVVLWAAVVLFVVALCVAAARADAARERALVEHRQRLGLTGAPLHADRRRRAVRPIRSSDQPSLELESLTSGWMAYPEGGEQASVGREPGAG